MAGSTVLAYVEHSDARYEFRAEHVVMERATIVLYQRANTHGVPLDPPLKLAEEQVYQDHARLVIKQMARQAIGAGFLHFTFAGSDPWEQGARLATLTEREAILPAPTLRENPPENGGSTVARPDDSLDLLGRGGRARGTARTADPALARFDAAQAERERRRDNLLNEAWADQAREVATYGKAGSPLFLDCVRLLVAFAHCAPGIKARTIARAYVVPHLAVATPPDEVNLRAAEYVAYALGDEDAAHPSWWREGY